MDNLFISINITFIGVECTAYSIVIITLIGVKYTTYL